MPKRGGGKRKGGKRKGGAGAGAGRELVLRDDDQVYAKVTKALGNKRMLVECYDGKTRQGTIRGTIRQRISVDDLVLVALRTEMTDDTKCDIIGKYTPEEARRLKKQGELPEAAVLGARHAEPAEDDDMPFDFADI